MSETSIKRLASNTPGYPANLRATLGDNAATLTTIGDPALLQRRALALVCSVRCPGDLILRAYDLALALRDAGIPVAGGFHSPMERECLRLLLRGAQPVILCPARAISTPRIPAAWRPPIEQGRLLLVSPFTQKQRRVTAETAQRRNRFVAALADALFVVHATPGGKTEALCHEALGWGKPLLTFDSPANAALLASGAHAVAPESIRDWWLAAEHDHSSAPENS